MPKPGFMRPIMQYRLVDLTRDAAAIEAELNELGKLGYGMTVGPVETGGLGRVLVLVRQNDVDIVQPGLIG